MRESIVSKQVLNAVLVKACESRARRVSHVRGWVSESTQVDPHEVANQFAALAKGTAAEGARLDLDLRPVVSGEAMGVDHIVVEVA